jgi:hypothetical protein
MAVVSMGCIGAVRYFSEQNLVFVLVPNPVTLAMVVSKIPAAINPMTVAPVSSPQNFRTDVIMRERCVRRVNLG